MTEIITSRSNPAVKHIVRLTKDAKYRAEHKQFVCEGLVMLNEAIRSHTEILTIFIDSDLQSLHNIPENIKIIRTTKEIINLISSVDTPQGIVFVCGVKSNTEPLSKSGGIIVLDGLADPGNMGTVIRTADAFAIPQIVLLGQCVDIYNPKVVRASMGALFRMNVLHFKTADEFFNVARSAGIKTYAAALCKEAKDIRQVNINNSAVIIGNEANGVSAEVLSKADERIIIPMQGGAESLNASIAAAIAMWEMKR